MRLFYENGLEFERFGVKNYLINTDIRVQIPCNFNNLFLFAWQLRKTDSRFRPMQIPLWLLLQEANSVRSLGHLKNQISPGDNQTGR